MGAAEIFKQSNPPSVTGTNVVIVPRTRQADGLDFYIGSNLIPAIKNARAENSGLQDIAKCQSKIASIIKPGSQDLQARAALGAVLLILPWIVELVSIALAYGYFLLSDGQMRGHVPGSDLDKISAAQPAATLVYAVSTSQTAAPAVHTTADEATTRITVTGTIVAAPSLR